MRILLLLLLLTVSAYASPIYVYKQKDGTIKFTTKKPPESVKSIEFKGRESNFSYYTVRVGFPHRGLRPPKKLITDKFTNEIKEAAEKHNIPESLIRAVIHIESAFNPKAVSPKGARGLMQLMPDTARDLGVKNSFAAHENIHGGTRYLAWLLKRYKGNTAIALAAYNAGPGAVEAYGGIPPYAETRAYVKNVLALKDRYAAG